MNQIEKDKKIYFLARNFLPQLGIAGIDESLIMKYLHAPENTERPDSIPEIYKYILISVQNANMKAGVIGKAIGGVEKLGGVLFDFEPTKILTKFTDWEHVLGEIEQNLHPNGQIRRTSRSLWPQYCKAILSAAQFMAQFSSAEEFYSWADFFDQDDRARAALALLLSTEISGLGFALACDFLKGIGYVNFAKPDVHLRNIFVGINLCDEKASDYQVFKTIIRVAKNSEVTPYNVDKLFWLIGSGNFYDDPHIGTIRSYKKQFITFVNSQPNYNLG